MRREIRVTSGTADLLAAAEQKVREATSLYQGAVSEQMAMARVLLLEHGIPEAKPLQIRTTDNPALIVEVPDELKDEPKDAG